MTLKVLVAAFFALASPCMVTACSSTSDPSTSDIAPNEADGSLPPDAAIGDAPASQPKSDGSGGGIDGGIVCRTRCEKAACADLEACVELCAKQAAKIPPSCQPVVTALEACVDTKGTWKCDRGAAKGTGPCSNEAVAVLNCALASVDGGLGDAAADAR